MTNATIGTPASPSPWTRDGLTIIKGAEWVLTAEQGEGAPEGIYGAQCLMCFEVSVLSDNDVRPVGVWAIEHTRKSPSHCQFRLTTERFCRVDPTPAVPTPKPPWDDGQGPPSPSAGDQPPGRQARARQRTWKIPPAARRLAARSCRYAGPLLLIAISVTCGLVVGIVFGTGSG